MSLTFVSNKFRRAAQLYRKMDLSLGKSAKCANLSAKIRHEKAVNFVCKNVYLTFFYTRLGVQLHCLASQLHVLGANNALFSEVSRFDMLKSAMTKKRNFRVYTLVHLSFDKYYYNYSKC